MDPTWKNHWPLSTAVFQALKTASQKVFFSTSYPFNVLTILIIMAILPWFVNKKELWKEIIYKAFYLTWLSFYISILSNLWDFWSHLNSLLPLHISVQREDDIESSVASWILQNGKIRVIIVRTISNVAIDLPTVAKKCKSLVSGVPAQRVGSCLDCSHSQSVSVLHHIELEWRKKWCALSRTFSICHRRKTRVRRNKAGGDSATGKKICFLKRRFTEEDDQLEKIKSPQTKQTIC